MNKIAILIINHETPAETQKLVNHLHCDKTKFDLTLVENSTFHCVEFPDIKNNFNKGFDQTVIDWLKDNKDENYLGYWTLNSDCLLEEVDYVSEICKFLEDKRIGLLSTLVHEKVAPGWGDHTPLQHPQNIDTGYPSEIGYIDFQSAIISKTLLDNFKIDNNLVYYLGGLDMDFNLACEKNGLKKILIPHLKLEHLGAQSYREEDGSLIIMRKDEIVAKEELEHIKKWHLDGIVSNGGQLMGYGINKRYGCQLALEKTRMLQVTTKKYDGE